VRQLALSVENLRKSYSGGASARRVLQGVSLSLAEGDYVAIMGESGAGKSTLLNLIAGLDVPDEGRISVAGQELATLDDAARTRLRRSRMGFVFQAFHLLPHLNIERNVALPLALNGIGGEAAAARVAEILAAVHLGGRARSFPSQLSGGEMQRVAVARALVHKPALVLADEPTGNLDADSAGEVLQLLRQQLKRDGAAGILVTHSTIAAATADRVYRLAADGLSLLDPGLRTTSG
jgi:putative ABC transport system ATP-binding protein